MIDKRKFHYFLNNLKDNNEEYIELLESIQNKFEKEFIPITDAELKALKQYPIQFVEKIPEENGEWTSQLHIWAEQGVPEILNIEPIYLAFKNSVDDSVLMCLVISATGAYTETVNYELIEKILNTDLDYDIIEKDNEGKEKTVHGNVLDVTDLNDQTIIDFLIDFAFATGKYEGQIEDIKLQEILKKFSNVNSQPEKEEEIEQIQEKEEENAEKEVDVNETLEEKEEEIETDNKEEIPESSEKTIEIENKEEIPESSEKAKKVNKLIS